MSKSFVIAIAFGLAALGIVGAGASRRNSQDVERADAIVSTAPDAPMTLTILTAKNGAVDDHAVELEALVTNASDKGVSAYAIKYDLVLNGVARQGGLEFSQSSTAKSILWPGDIRTESIGGGHYSSRIERIIVSLDFVEFTDGTSWGPDTNSSKDLLAGMRAGAQTMAAHLRDVFGAKGATSLSAELEGAANELGTAAAASVKWREGFQRGAAFIRERAKREIKNFAPAEVGRILSLPIDALDDLKRR